MEQHGVAFAVRRFHHHILFHHIVLGERRAGSQTRHTQTHQAEISARNARVGD